MSCRRPLYHPPRHLPRRLSLLLLGGLCSLYSLSALADQETGNSELDPEEAAALRELQAPANVLEAGIGHSTRRSAKAGEYDGSASRGPVATTRLTLHGPASDDLGATDLRWRLGMRLNGALESGNLNANERDIDFRAAQPGQWRATVRHNHWTRVSSDSFQTPLRNVGSDRLTLPAGWSANNATTTKSSALPELDSAMQRQVLSTTRDDTGLTLRWQVDRQQRLDLSLRQLDRQGLQATGAAIGGLRGLTLPEAIDQRTTQLALGWQRLLPQGQVRFGYSGSFFRNGLTSLSFANPYGGSSSGNNAGLPWGRLATAPDNTLHQLNTDGSLYLGKHQQLRWQGSLGRLTQDQPFLPYYATDSSSTLPRAALGGDIRLQQWQLRYHDARLAGREDLAWTVHWRHELRDNRTPVSTYRYLSSPDKATTASSGWLETANRPYSRRRDTLSSELAGQLDAERSWRLGLEQEEVRRYCREQASDSHCLALGTSRETTLRGEWRQALGADWLARLGSSVGQFRGDGYQTQASPDDLAGLRKFFLADRQRQRWSASLDYHPARWQLSTSLALAEDRYRQSPLGLQDSRQASWSVDAAYPLSAEADVHAFWVLDRYRSTVNGHAWSSSGSAEPVANCSARSGTTDMSNSASDPCRDWQGRLHDTVYTLGIGSRQQGLLRGRLELQADWLLSLAMTRYALRGGNYYSDGSNLLYLPASDLPTVSRRRQEIRLRADYRIDRGQALLLDYRFQQLQAQDYAWDGISNRSLQSYIGTGEQLPATARHQLWLGWRWSL